MDKTRDQIIKEKNDRKIYLMDKYNGIQTKEQIEKIKKQDQKKLQKYIQ